MNMKSRARIQSGLKFGTRNFVHPDGLPFWKFLEKSGIDYSKPHFPFLSWHAVPEIKPVFDFGEYLSLSSRGEAIAYLYKGLGKTLNYVGPLLDLERKHGFNDHTDRHTLWVSQTGVELLQRAGVSFDGRGKYDSQTEALMTLVGMTHDLGNLLSRKDHSEYSIWMLSKMFKNLRKFPKEWEVVEYAIRFHEEPVIRERGLDLSKGSPLQWALVAADKMHVGRDRVGEKSLDSGIAGGALEEDEYILLNSLVVRSSWHLGKESFLWHLDFSVDQLDQRFVSLTKGKDRLWVTDLLLRNYREKGINFRDTFRQLFSATYGDRIKMAAESIFLLFSFARKFEVTLVDNDTRNKVGSGEIRILRIERKS